MNVSDGKFVTQLNGFDTLTNGHYPGYSGFCPRQKYHYGKSLGNATRRYFQVQRENLSCDKTRQAILQAYGTTQQPTLNTHDVGLALSARCLQRDRFRAAEKYSLNNKGKREAEILNFARIASEHRDHYLDVTGLVPKVDFFILPKIDATVSENPKFFSSRETCVEHKENESSSVQNEQGQGGVSVSDAPRTNFVRKTKLLPRSLRTHRDREVRDVFFEQR